MRHHLGGEEIHVPTRQIVGQDAELQEGHKNAEAGALAHPLDPCEHRLGLPISAVPLSIRPSAVALPPPTNPRRMLIKFFIEPVEV
jgi:hypothetical protein